MAQRVLELGIVHASTREQFGRPIGGFQLTQRKLADMAVELSKGQLLALHLGRLKDDGRVRPEQVSLGKLNNVREAIDICRTARTILGANGISLEYPVMRHATNLESVLTYEGTVEMHQLVLGKALTELDEKRVQLTSSLTGADAFEIRSIVAGGWGRRRGVACAGRAGECHGSSLLVRSGWS